MDDANERLDAIRRGFLTFRAHDAIHGNAVLYEALRRADYFEHSERAWRRRAIIGWIAAGVLALWQVGYSIWATLPR